MDLPTLLAISLGGAIVLGLIDALLGRLVAAAGTIEGIVDDDSNAATQQDHRER